MRLGSRPHRGRLLLVIVRPMEPADAPSVREISRLGIATGDATFEAAPPEWDHFDRSRRADLRYVATVDEVVVGWVAVAPVSSRDVYRGVVEHSVYVHPDHAGEGVGRALLDRLIRDAEDAGVWTIQSSVFPENAASLRLHAAAGFRIVGRRERIALMTYGLHAGRWRDTILIEWRRPA